jgi:hypothetical protein
MDEPAVADAPVTYPWYSLNPKSVKTGRLLRIVLVVLGLCLVSVVPLWRLGWYVPVYGFRAFIPVRDAGGWPRAAWRWIDGKEIRVYGAPGANATAVREVARGVRALLDEVGLDFTVKELPMPAAVEAAFTASLEPHDVNGATVQRVRFSRLAGQLITLRQGDPHADVIVTHGTEIAEHHWAHGMGDFSSGLSVMRDFTANVRLGKHETGHLMGYLFHDDLPFFVFGYDGELCVPAFRQTLMMINYNNSDTLSPRAKDALTYFWKGLEARSGRKFFRVAQ